MLSNQAIFFLVLAGAAAAYLIYYEESRRKSIYGMAYHGNARIMPGAGIQTLYAASTDEKTCRAKVDALHAAGTPLGGFDYGQDGLHGDPACHIYGPMSADNHTLMAESGYTAYVGPNQAHAADREESYAFLPAPTGY